MTHRIRFVQGNEICVEGVLYAGLSFLADYPIAPSTEIAELLADLVKPESVLEAIRDRVPAGFVEINTAAFRLGFDLGRPFRRCPAAPILLVTFGLTSDRTGNTSLRPLTSFLFII